MWCLAVVTDLIVNDAHVKQRGVRDKLGKLEEECLLGKRDSLMAHGVMCELLDSDCKNNIKFIEKQVSE